MPNTFGHLFRITTWGESHGPAVGVVLDGCPPRLPLAAGDIQADLDRRRPGQSDLVTPRQEEDRVEILAGLFEGSEGPLRGPWAGPERQSQRRSRPGLAVGEQRQYRGVGALDRWQQEPDLEAALPARREHETVAGCPDLGERRELAAQASQRDPEARAVGRVRVARTRTRV